MKTPFHHPHRTSNYPATRPATQSDILSPQAEINHPTLQGLRRPDCPLETRLLLALTLYIGALPAVCAAQEAAPEPDASLAPPSAAWSPEGSEMLVTIVVLAVALVLMERLCAWRLRVRQRRAWESSQALSEALPSLPILGETPRPPAANLRAYLPTILAALGTLLFAGATVQAQTLYVANADNNQVGAYNAATGAAAAGFTPPAGLSGVGDVAVAGNTLYVVDYGSVHAYNARTGAAMTSFAGPTNLSGGLGVTVVGNTLYVSETTADDVCAFDATTGAALAGFALSGGIHEPADIAVTGNVLYLARGGDGLISTYNAATGAPINAGFITLVGTGQIPFGLALSGGTLYVSNFNGSTVSEYDATTGTLLNGSFITGLQRPAGLTLAGNTLYVANSAGNTVGAYDALTGAPVTGFVSPSGLDNPFGVAVAGVPEPGPCVLVALCAVAGMCWCVRRQKPSPVG